ncbi:MAG: succinylglutamate desuccinylase [Betaproteobacteria bacterium]|nr:succinylglutamate desuccinylase [Betaproteobacteria bacterium]
MSGLYPIEIPVPDLSPYRHGNTGVDYCTTIDSGKKGPHVLLAALTHGNELCGAIVLDELMRRGLRPLRGRLTVGFMNVAAFGKFDPGDPESSRWVEEDFNRVWDPAVLDGPRRSADLERARAVRALVDDADFLLDIHSMQHPSPPLIISGPLEKGRALAIQVGFPPLVVSDHGHAAGRRMRDYAGFGDPASPRNAVLVECGQHWARSTVDVARETTLRFLLHCGVISREFAGSKLSARPPAARVIEITHPITIRSEQFRFAGPYSGLEVIARAGTVIGWDGGEEVKTPYDDCVLVMPSKRLYRGQTAVRLGRYLS